MKIEDLEKLLEEDDVNVEILPNGDIVTSPKPSKPTRLLTHRYSAPTYY